MRHVNTQIQQVFDMEHNCYLYMINIKKFTFTLLLSFIHKIKHIFKQLKRLAQLSFSNVVRFCQDVFIYLCNFIILNVTTQAILNYNFKALKKSSSFYLLPRQVCPCLGCSKTRITIHYSISNCQVSQHILTIVYPSINLHGQTWGLRFPHTWHL